MNLFKKYSAFVFLIVALFACSENKVEIESSDVKDDRLRSIKEMYNEALLAGTKSCYSTIYDKSVSYGDDIPPRPFEQRVEKCTLNKEYTTINGKYQGLGWGEKCTYYFNNDTLFFALMEYQHESCSGEVKFYYDIKGEIIKTTLKTLECYEGKTYDEETEDFDSNLKTGFQSSIKENLKTAKRVLAQFPESKFESQTGN